MPNNHQNLQNEIKDIVISKLLDQVIIQYKELREIKEENKNLKGKLTNLCKRMIYSSKICFSPIKSHTYSTPKKTMIMKSRLLTNNRSPSKSRQSPIELPLKSKSPKSLVKGNVDCKSERFSHVDTNQNNETQLMFMSTRDKINSSYGLSLDSTYIQNSSFSPKQINSSFQYPKKKIFLEKKNTDITSSASSIKGKKVRIIKHMQTIEKIDEKNQIKVTMNKSRRK